MTNMVPTRRGGAGRDICGEWTCAVSCGRLCAQSHPSVCPGVILIVCSAATPEIASDFLRGAGLNVIDKAAELGTIEVHVKHNGQKYMFEHTTFRSDEYPEGGDHRPDRVVFTDDMEADARRRDFTVNALYLDIATGRCD